VGTRSQLSEQKTISFVSISVVDLDVPHLVAGEYLAGRSAIARWMVSVQREQR